MAGYGRVNSTASVASVSTTANSEHGTHAAGPEHASDILREWWWLNAAEQKLPVEPAAWRKYEPMVQYHLTAAWKSMLIEGRQYGLLLDLESFTDGGAPYQVWRGETYMVVNTSCRNHQLCGHLAIAGYDKELWNLPPTQLPSTGRHAQIVAGFYQVFRDDVHKLEELNRHLVDPRNQRPGDIISGPIRRRVVLLLEVERARCFYGDANRFRKKRQPASSEAPGSSKPGLKMENDTIPPGEAVFQWWWGDPQDPNNGHWKNYHKQVSIRLEKCLAENEKFRKCQEAVPIDAVRYSLQRISSAMPFNYLDQNREGNFREPFTPENIITIDYPLYDPATRVTNNCFVQFQKGNPKRRRPVRRIARGEAAGVMMTEGEPCGVCFSDAGVLTGCGNGHVMCKSCLRFGLRAVVGDITTIKSLLCGCLTNQDMVALENLAGQADDSLKALMENPPPESSAERQEFDMEMCQVRRAFQLSDDKLKAGIYRVKVKEWAGNVRKKELEHLYHACSQPGCDMENWILRKDFEETLRVTNTCTWTCKKGHRNSVIPDQREINEINRSILMHPEFYTTHCGCDEKPLRRFRLCPRCVEGGLLTFAVHEAGCKQWPGTASARTHRHCFCFYCTRNWGTECSHTASGCNDPGIQQVRRTVKDGIEVLQIGFIDQKAYIAWLSSSRAACPPTIFPGGDKIFGATRQGQLGMEDKVQLKQAMQEGTQ